MLNSKNETTVHMQVRFPYGKLSLRLSQFVRVLWASAVARIPGDGDKNFHAAGMGMNFSWAVDGDWKSSISAKIPPPG